MYISDIWVAFMVIFSVTWVIGACFTCLAYSWMIETEKSKRYLAERGGVLLMISSFFLVLTGWRTSMALFLGWSF